MHVRVIGVGSERGDDRAGLTVAGRIARGPLPAGVDVAVCTRPVLDLLDELVGPDAVVIVDAVQSGRPAGTVQRIPPESLRPQRGYSSHGLGVPEALALARELGRIPRRVEIVGIEVTGAAERGLSEAVARGVEVAIGEVRSLVCDLQLGTSSALSK